MKPHLHSASSTPLAALGMLLVSAAMAHAQTAAPAAAPAADSAKNDLTELAKKTQDPTSEIIAVPFQSNFDFGSGPGEDMQYLLNVQPVIPIPLNEEFKLLTRLVVPFIDQPLPEGGELFGMGDIQLTTWLAPAGKSEFSWSLGPITQFPTATDHRLGSGQWGMGPSGVLVYKHGPWVVGGLANNVFSLGGWTDTDVNILTVQPFLNYNLGKGLAIGLSPTITADWTADSNDERWTVPLGGSISQILKFGELPVKAGLSAYYNIVKPDNGPEWQLQLQFTLILPEK